MHDSEQIPLADEHRGAIPFVGRDARANHPPSRTERSEVQGERGTSFCFLVSQGSARHAYLKALALEAAEPVAFRFAGAAGIEWEGAPPFWPWIQVMPFGIAHVQRTWQRLNGSLARDS